MILATVLDMARTILAVTGVPAKTCRLSPLLWTAFQREARTRSIYVDPADPAVEPHACLVMGTLVCRRDDALGEVEIRIS